MAMTRLSLLCLLLLASCQQHQLSSGRGSLAYRNYPDAVTNIRQVDPAYRSYFSSQNGANYSIADQRKAFVAAAQTARTPVREPVARSSSASPAKKKLRPKKASPVKKRTVGRKTTAAKGKSKQPARKKPAARSSTKKKR